MRMPRFRRRQSPAALHKKQNLTNMLPCSGPEESASGALCTDGSRTALAEVIAARQ